MRINRFKNKQNKIIYFVYSAEKPLKPGLDESDRVIEDYPGNSLSPTDGTDNHPEDSRPAYVTIRAPVDREKSGNDTRSNRGHANDTPFYTGSTERTSRANIPIGIVMRYHFISYRQRHFQTYPILLFL